MKRMQSAGLGLVLLLGSFLILNTINPQLTELKMPTIPSGSKGLDSIEAEKIGLPTAKCENAILFSGINKSGESIPLSPGGKIDPLSQEVGSVVIEGSCQLTLYKLTGLRENADNIPVVISAKETPDVGLYGTTKFGSAKLNSLYIAP